MARRNKLYSFRKSIRRNAPTIATIGSVIATGVALYLTGKATFKAVNAVNEMKKNEEQPTTKQILKKVVPYYIPAGIAAVTAVTLSITSNTIHVKRERMLSAALLASNEALTMFREKLTEKVSGETVKQITELPMEEKEVDRKPMIEPNDYIWIYDEFSGYKFRTTYGKLLEAEKEVNRRLNNNDRYTCKGYVDYDDFFKMMDVQPTMYIRNFCWDSSDTWDLWDTAWIDFYHEETQTPDGCRMIILRYSIDPLAKEKKFIN